MKKLAAGLLTAAIIINGMAVFADGGTITSISTDPDTQYITVSGVINSDNDRERVTLRITKKGTTPDKDTILYTYQVNTDENGEYNFGFTMPDGTEMGDYDVYVKSDNTEQLTKSFRYFGDISSVLKNNINGAKSVAELRTFFESGDNDGMIMFGIDTETYEKLSDDGKNFVASAVYQTKNKLGGYTDGKQLRDTFNQAVLLEEIREGKATINDDNIGALTVDYSNVKDGNYGAYLTLYASAKKANDEVRANTISAIKSSTVKDAESFWSAYNNSVMNTIISNTEYWTEVRDFISDNKEIIDKYASVDWSKYNSNSQAVCKELVRGNFADMNNFAAAIKTTTSALNNSGNTTGGGSSGGSGGGSSSGGSGSGITSSTVTLPAPDNTTGNTTGNTSASNPNNSYKFDDVRRTPWANDAISYLVDKNVISGYGDGTFRPENYITRAEFVTLVVKAFYANTEMTDCDFEDVAKTSWSYPYIAAASNLGLVHGISDTEFAPDENIKRQDMAVIVKNILENKGYSNSGDDVSAFADENDISDYAVSAVNTLKKAGIVNGDEDNNFKPLDRTTRAEAAVIVYNVIGGELNE